MLEVLSELRDVHACSRVFFAMGTFLLVTFGVAVYAAGSNPADHFASAATLKGFSWLHGVTSESPGKSLVHWSFGIA